MTPTELRAERKRLGLTQAATAQVLGVHLTTVQRWEQGDRRIPKAAQLVLESAEVS